MMILGLILEGHITVLHLGPPCSSFSMAFNRFLAQRIRSWEHPEGLPDLRPDQQLKVDLGNQMAELSVTLARAQMRVKRFFQFEQPASSLMLRLPSVLALMADPAVHTAVRCICADGAPWRKPTAIIGNSESVMQMAAPCPGCASHTILQGKAPDGRAWTAVASPYWPGFAQKMARSWSWAKSVGRSKDGVTPSRMEPCDRRRD